MVMQVRRTPTPNNPPTGLLDGQLSVGMADNPPTLWSGVPTSIDASGRVQLLPGSYVTSSALTTALTSYAPVNNPAFTGSVTLPGNTAAAPGGNLQAVPLQQMTTALGAYLPLTGGTLATTGGVGATNGNLTIRGAAANGLTLGVVGGQPTIQWAGGSDLQFSSSLGGVGVWERTGSFWIGSPTNITVGYSGSAGGSTWGFKILPNGTMALTDYVNDLDGIAVNNFANNYNVSIRGLTINSPDGWHAIDLGPPGNLYSLALNGPVGTLQMFSPAGVMFQCDFGGNFYVTAKGWQPGGGPWADSSDSRIKNVHGDYLHGLDEIERLNPCRYSFRGNDDDDGHKKAADARTEFVGLIAQEIEEIMPEMVTRRKGKIDGKEVDDLRDLDTGPLIYALVNAVKELSARVKELENGATSA